MTDIITVQGPERIVKESPEASGGVDTEFDLYLRDKTTYDELLKEPEGRKKLQIIQDEFGKNMDAILKAYPNKVLVLYPGGPQSVSAHVTMAYGKTVPSRFPGYKTLDYDIGNSVIIGKDPRKYPPFWTEGLTDDQLRGKA
jgi:hypothetical protein